MVSMAMEEYELMKDKNYRAYVAEVDKALKSFEPSSSFSDVVSALDKLNKVLNNNKTKFPVIPRRMNISKRLAQCMLTDTSGVHLKVLETYDFIFKIIGTGRLSQELFIYSVGIFPFYGSLSVKVKPKMLQVYETHFVPLGPRLLPGLPGFLNGVLPGLVEGTDHFERTNALLKKVCDGVGPTAFYGCLWQSVADNTVIRLPALTFVLTHFNKKLAMEQQPHFMGNNVEVVVKALCAGVQDTDVLVQRTSLDILQCGFPMHCAQLVTADMLRIVTASLSVILRGDMPLNRRLFAWLLGTDLNPSEYPSDHPLKNCLAKSPDGNKSRVYFELYSKDYLIRGFKETLKELTSDIRPYRILSSLISRDDIGPAILDDVLFDFLRLLYFTWQSDHVPESTKRKEEVIKSASSVISWDYIGTLFDQACKMTLDGEKNNVSESSRQHVRPVGSGIPDIWEVCELTQFILNVIPVKFEQLTNLLLRLVALLTKHLNTLTPDQLHESLLVIQTVLRKMHPQDSRSQTVIEPERCGDVVRPALVREGVGKDKANLQQNEQSLEYQATRQNKEQDSDFGQMMRVFLKDFQTFFVAFVSGGRIFNNMCVPQAFEKLKKITLSSNENYAEELRKLLNTVIAESSPDKMGSSETLENSESTDFQLIVPGNEIWGDCFEVACAVFVDFAKFPLGGDCDNNNSVSLPPWQKTLLVACCYLDSSPSLQLTAIRTLLDLLTENEEGSKQPLTVLIALSQAHYIQRNTNIVRVVTEILWKHLGQLSPQKQISCIQLLHQLLNIFTLDDSVERTLGEALLRGDDAAKLEALLRFIKLWTIGRELQYGRQRRYFQLCLLKILDNLLLPDHSPLRLQTESWLTQTLTRGDMARLLDPLLLILLDPATSRMGIRHVSIEPSAAEIAPEEVQLEDTNKIYAISSVDGNVIFHVSDTPRKGGLPKRIKWHKKKKGHSEKHVYAVTSLKGSPDSQLRYITEKNVARGIEIPRPPSGEVSLFVNPLNARYEEETVNDSPSQVPEAVRNAKRLNPKTAYEDAEEKGGESKRIVKSILDSMIDSVVRKYSVFNPSEPAGVGVHPLHSHLLLYCDIYDSTRTLYAFNGLRNILFANPRLFLWCAATSGTVSASFPSYLLVLLARHQKSVYGRGFEGSTDSVNEYIPAFRSTMYLEVLVIVCLYHACSYYPNLGHRLTPEILAENRLVQLTSIELLTDVFTELLPLIRVKNEKNFANYIRTNILQHCEVQSKVLHCLMSSLSSIQQQQQPHSQRLGGRTFTEEIIEFNDASDGTTLTEHSRALQIHLLKLTLALIKLEHFVEDFKSDPADGSPHPQMKEFHESANDASYSPDYSVPRQALFLRAVGSSLSIKGSMRVLHCHWTALVLESLPYLGSAMKDIIGIVINQLCVNVEELADVYANRVSGDDLPPDYAIMEMEALTLLCHYCLLDSQQQVSSFALTTGETSSASGSLPNPSQIFSNLVHVFTPLHLMQELGKERNQQQEVLAEVRRSCLLSLMPRIITSLASVWTAITNNWVNDEIKSWGSPRVIRSQILEFFSPLSLNHGPCFLTAISVVWFERRDKQLKTVIPIPTAEQKVLVGLLGSIKVMPIDTLVQTLHSVVKQPLPIDASLKDMTLEVSVLELFFVYMQTSTPAQLAECWPSLLALLKDGHLLPPSALFLLLAILNEFVQSSPPFLERKDQRDLQDITSKLIEECSKVAGACIEHNSFWLQKTWLKSTSVRDFDSVTEETEDETSKLLNQSAQAQLVLAQILAPLLDVSFGSQEKDKAANLLLTVMGNITPYLREHQPRYAKCFRASSQLLANISGYNYMRKAWKKDAFDLLLDPTLFQMEADCLPHWSVIVDHLMIDDQTTFHDLLSRFQNQSGLFSSREQEYEQRAQLLKRLAFVLMCSQTDQYTKSILLITNRLSENLRLNQVGPSIQAQVFFCFRALLLRMSPQNLTTLWPIIINEMVQVFTHIEQELTNETEEFRHTASSYIKLMSGLDSSFVTNSNNGLHAHGHPHWLLLALAAAKLLDLAVLMPASVLPQFQMYRWAFVGDDQGLGKALPSGQQDFVPHVKRISKLMDEKFGSLPVYVRAKEGRLIITKSSIESLKELQLFFYAIQSRPQATTVDMQEVEKHIFLDFLETNTA